MNTIQEPDELFNEVPQPSPLVPILVGLLIGGLLLAALMGCDRSPRERARSWDSQGNLTIYYEQPEQKPPAEN